MLGCDRLTGISERHVELAIEILLFDIWEQQNGPGGKTGISIGMKPAGWKTAQLVVEIMGAQADLFQIVLAAQATGRFSHFLNGRQKHADQNGNNGNDHQDFDKREGSTKQ